jgi:hypothetical protein
MSAGTLAVRRRRIVERIAAGRADVVDAIDIALEPLRRIDRFSAALRRGFDQSRGVAPMLYPLAPVALLGAVRGRRHIGGALVRSLRFALRSVAIARALRQLGPFIDAFARSARRHAARR